MDANGVITLSSEPNVRKLFTPVIYILECLSLACHYNLILCMRVRLEPTRVKHLLGVPLFGRLMNLPTNIRLGREGLPGTNTQAYYE